MQGEEAEPGDEGPILARLETPHHQLGARRRAVRWEVRCENEENKPEGGRRPSAGGGSGGGHFRRGEGAASRAQISDGMSDGSILSSTRRSSPSFRSRLGLSICISLSLTDLVPAAGVALPPASDGSANLTDTHDPGEADRQTDRRQSFSLADRALPRPSDEAPARRRRTYPGNSFHFTSLRARRNWHFQSGREEGLRETQTSNSALLPNGRGVGRYPILLHLFTDESLHPDSLNCMLALTTAPGCGLMLGTVTGQSKQIPLQQW